MRALGRLNPTVARRLPNLPQIHSWNSEEQKFGAGLNFLMRVVGQNGKPDLRESQVGHFGFDSRSEIPRATRSEVQGG